MTGRVKLIAFPIFLLLLLGIVFVFSLCCGTIWLNPLDLFTRQDISSLILKLRIIRSITAFIVGGALAVSGLAYQSVLKNPLAEPYILGISGGASLGAALAIMLGLSALTVFAVPLFAFVFALLALCIVLLLSRGNYAEYSESILLSGVIVGSVCSSILMFIISSLGFNELNSVTWWMLGNLQAADTGLLKIATAVTLGGTALLFIYGRRANLISMGGEMAHNMGVSPAQTVVVLLGTASLMAAAAVSLAGIISFVGLIVPHILRRLFGADHRRLFPLGLICGGMFLIICDTVSRSTLAAQEIPVGVITALIGGPFFIWLLNRRKGACND
jgi:iron complex transport system permease protein